MGNSDSRPPEAQAFDIVNSRKKTGGDRLKKLLGEQNAECKRALLDGARDQTGRTLLMVACLLGDAACVYVLLSEGAAVGLAASSGNGWSALHYACSSKREDKAPDVISLLLMYHADPTARGSQGQMPFHVAQLSRRVPALRQLESRVCDFVGALSVEVASGLQRTAGSLLGDGARSLLVQQAGGGTWKKKWVVITRLQGSVAMGKYPRLRCPSCLVHQPALQLGVAPTVPCVECAQPLIMPPLQRNVYNCLTVYKTCNSELPQAVYDLTGSKVSKRLSPSGFTAIDIQFSPDALRFVDPVYFSVPGLQEKFRKTRKRLAVVSPTTLRLAAPADNDLFELAFAALARKLRSYPEPGGVVHQASQLGGALGAAGSADSLGALPATARVAGLPAQPQLGLGAAAPQQPAAAAAAAAAAATGALVPASSSLASPSGPVPPPRNGVVVDSLGYDSDIPMAVELSSPAEPEKAPSRSPIPAPTPPLPPRPPTPPPRQGGGIAVQASAPAMHDLETDLFDSAKRQSLGATAAAATLSATAAPAAALGGPKAASSASDLATTEAFRCPITHQLLRDPVLTCDGISFEREAIASWFAKGNTTSPVTGEQLDTTQLVPNIALRKAIQRGAI
jgi:hypothetical protein